MVTHLIAHLHGLLAEASLPTRILFYFILFPIVYYILLRGLIAAWTGTFATPAQPKVKYTRDVARRSKVRRLSKVADKNDAVNTSKWVVLTEEKCKATDKNNTTTAGEWLVLTEQPKTAA